MRAEHVACIFERRGPPPSLSFIVTFHDSALIILPSFWFSVPSVPSCKIRVHQCSSVVDSTLVAPCPIEQRFSVCQLFLTFQRHFCPPTANFAPDVPYI